MGYPRVAGDLRGVVYNSSDYYPHGVRLYSGVYPVHRFGRYSTSSVVAGDRVYRRHTKHCNFLQGAQVILGIRRYIYCVLRVKAQTARYNLGLLLSVYCSHNLSTQWVAALGVYRFHRC